MLMPETKCIVTNVREKRIQKKEPTEDILHEQQWMGGEIFLVPSSFAFAVVHEQLPAEG